MNTPTPKSDKNTYNKHQDNCPTSVVPSLICRQLERELIAAREEIDMMSIRYAAAEMHHANNMQEVTEQLTIAREELNTAREDQAYMHKDLTIAIEQRDRLADALQTIIRIYEKPDKGCIPCSSDMYDVALQSIKI